MTDRPGREFWESRWALWSAIQRYVECCGGVPFHNEPNRPEAANGAAEVEKAFAAVELEWQKARSTIPDITEHPGPDVPATIVSFEDFVARFGLPPTAPDAIARALTGHRPSPQVARVAPSLSFTLHHIFDRIESEKFASEVNIASGLKTAVRIALENEIVAGLLALMEEDREIVRAVETRLAEMAEKLRDPQVEYRYDAAALAYLSLLDQIDPEGALKTVGLLLNAPNAGLMNGFWCRLLLAKWFSRP